VLLSLADWLGGFARGTVCASRIEGYGALSSSLFTTGTVGLLAPLPAAVLGLVLGGVLVLVSKWAVKFVTPADPVMGMAKALLVNAWTMGVAIASLAAFYVWDRPALSWFGIALALGFLTVASVELLRYGSGSMTQAARRR
jgi:hypothetical protein